MIIYWRIPISLTLRAPWITPGDAAPDPSTDIVLARNKQGDFILPASFIKGNLRAAIDQLVIEECENSDLRDACFGTLSATRAKGTPAHPWQVANEPERGALIFGDLVSTGLIERENGRTGRIEIDQEFHAAKEGHLLFVECPFKFGTNVPFVGEILFIPRDGCNETDVTEMIKLALGRLFAIGGMKSVGFGRVAEFNVGVPNPVTPAKPSVPSQNLAISYEIDRSFIVDSVRHSGNLSVGSSTIPGSAIKGVIARGFQAAGVDAESFISKMSVSHAEPNGRKVLPLSLSVCDKKVFCNLDGEVKSGLHKFASDWKDDGDMVREVLGDGWAAPNIQYSGRTRTAINSDSLTSEYEHAENGEVGSGKLFSQMAVMPDNMEWHGTLRLPKGRECSALVLGLLEVGIPGLGKTGAVLSGKATIWDLPDAQDAELSLTLTSDACLFSPEQALSHGLESLYQKYFAAMGFELKTWSAQQVMKGGYLSLRYPAVQGKYMPWLLTKAGSVFRVVPNKQADVADVLANGLPPAKGLPTDWRAFPFLRENGFGQVKHDIISHAKFVSGVGL